MCIDTAARSCCWLWKRRQQRCIRRCGRRSPTHVTRRATDAHTSRVVDTALQHRRKHWSVRQCGDVRCGGCECNGRLGLGERRRQRRPRLVLYAPLMLLHVCIYIVRICTCVCSHANCCWSLAQTRPVDCLPRVETSTRAAAPGRDASVCASLTDRVAQRNEAVFPIHLLVSPQSPLLRRVVPLLCVYLHSLRAAMLTRRACGHPARRTRATSTFRGN